MNFTPSQGEAILTDSRDVVVVAGPGSGKTATTVARIKRLIADGVNPAEIVAITFTNAGARELQERLALEVADSRAKKAVTDILRDGEAVVNTEPPKLGFCGTLHSFALRMLQEYGEPFGYGARMSLISPESAQDLLASKAKSLGCKTPIKKLLALKAKGRPPPPKTPDLDVLTVIGFLDDLKSAGIVDYDILLDEFRRMVCGDDPEQLQTYLKLHNRFSFLFVDEAQDSAPVDWDIYEAFGMASKFFVGDPDQSIFGFRKADMRRFLRHCQLPGVTVLRLQENFRSTPEVCDIAQRVVSQNKHRLDKATLSAVDHRGAFLVHVCDSEGMELAFVAQAIKSYRKEAPFPAESIAVLSRTNAIAKEFREKLPHMGVPVVALEESDLPFDWPLCRAYLELMVNPDNDALAFFYVKAMKEKAGLSPAAAAEAAHKLRRMAQVQRISLNQLEIGIAKPVTDPALALRILADSGISKEAQRIVAEKFHDLPRGATMVELALSIAQVRQYAKESEETGCVHILTAHASKGREFDVVFVVGVEQEVWPGRAARDGDELAIEEERRLLYVAITRARYAAILSAAKTRTQRWGTRAETQTRTPSAFLNEICPHP